MRSIVKGAYPDTDHVVYDNVTGTISRDDLSIIFPEQSFTGPQLDFAYSVIQPFTRAVSAFSAFAGWRMSQGERVLHTRHLRRSDFFASAGPLLGEEQEYVVQLAIGCPVLMLSLATDLLLNVGRVQATRANPFKQLLQTLPSETGQARILELVVDATLLLYFHEIAHVMLGHCKYDSQTGVEDRALETDADYSSGMIFSLWLHNIPAEWFPAKPVSDDELVDRLIRASFVLGLALREFSAPSDRYHLPTTRTFVTVEGAIYGFTQAGITPTFKAGAQGDAWWEARVLAIEAPLRAAFTESPLAHLAGTELQLAEDAHELHCVTRPAWDRLKSGPLANLSLAKALNLQEPKAAP